MAVAAQPGSRKLGPPHIPKQGCHHAGEEKIDHVVRQRRNIGTIQPLHPGEGKSGKEPFKNYPHDHAHTTVKENETEARTHQQAERLGDNCHINPLPCVQTAPAFRQRKQQLKVGA